MNRTLTLPAVLAVMLLVIGFDYATFAATGDSLILGKTNKAGKATELKRTTAGPALRLETKLASDPPVTTNAKGKVKHWNADRLDGLDSDQLGVRPIVFTMSPATYSTEFEVFPLTGVPPGRYLAAVNTLIDSTTEISYATCHLTNVTADEVAMIALGIPGNASAVITSTGYVEVASGDALTLQCDASTTGTWGPSADIPSRLTLTPAAGVVAKTLAP